MDRQCPHCGHSRAAHLDGVRCAPCGCRSEKQAAVQDSFTFRTSLPIRAPSTRKR